MTRVTDEVLGKLSRQMHDWYERVRKGSLNPEELYHTVKPLIQRGILHKRLSFVHAVRLLPLTPPRECTLAQSLSNDSSAFNRNWRYGAGGERFVAGRVKRLRWMDVRACELDGITALPDVVELVGGVNKVRKHHLLTLSQVGQICDRHLAGEDYLLYFDGWTVFFVEWSGELCAVGVRYQAGEGVWNITKSLLTDKNIHVANRSWLYLKEL